MRKDSNNPLENDRPNIVGWIVSIALHVGLLALCIVIIPFSQDSRTEAPKPPETSVNQVQEVAKLIDKTHEELAREDVERMKQVLDELREVRDRQLEAIKPAQKELTDSAPQRAAEAQDRVLAAQDEALKETGPFKDDGSKERAAAIADKQGAAADAADEARRALEMAGEPFKEALDAQAEADQKQAQAADAADAAKKAMDSTEPSAKAAAEAKKRAAEAARRAADAAEKADKAKTSADAKAADADQAEKAAADAKTAAAAADGKKAQNEANKKASTAAKKAAEAAKKAADATEGAAKTARASDSAASKSSEAASAAKSASDAAEAKQADATEARKAVDDAQAAARSSQASARSKLQDAIAGGTKPAETEPAKDTEVAVDTSTIASSLASASQVEEQIGEAFRDLRAASQADIRQVGLSEARQSIQNVTPDRKSIDSSKLDKTVATDGQSLEDYKKAVAAATDQIKSMAELSESLLADAKAAADAKTDGSTVSSADSSNSSSNSSKSAELAMAAKEDPDAKAKDLTESMAGGKHSSGRSVEGSGYPHVPDSVLNMRNAARNIGTGGSASGWVYIDSWYVIGPWDNAGRRNANTMFPPESIIDLDGAYPGIDDKTLRWQFHQETSPKLTPPNDRAYAIFYAYTELKFDTPTDLWIAVGSDDNSNVWINGLPVWIHSGPERSWSPDHGYRKVHFKAGINRVLYRIENGWGASNWSLMLYVGQAGSTPVPIARQAK